MKKMYGCIEYKMPRAMANYYLDMRRGKSAKAEADPYLCRIVNEEFGLKGTCVHVIIED